MRTLEQRGSDAKELSSRHRGAVVLLCERLSKRTGTVPRQMQFRFPGRVELRYTYALPNVGEVVSSAGSSWRVAAVESDEDAIVRLLEPVNSGDAGRDLSPEEVGGFASSSPAFSGVAGSIWKSIQFPLRVRSPGAKRAESTRTLRIVLGRGAGFPAPGPSLASACGHLRNGHLAGRPSSRHALDGPGANGEILATAFN